MIDFKSGSIFNDDGFVKDEYLFQIGLYGLMVREHFPEFEIALEIYGLNDSWRSTFDLNLKNKLTLLVESMKNKIPLGKKFSLQSLTALGEHCKNCKSRSACPEYFESLKFSQPNSDNTIISSEDFYGEIIEIKEIDIFLEIKLKSLKNTTVSISGLPKVFFKDLKIGVNLACYGLRYYDHDSRCSFPANFYLYRADIPILSSFEAVILR